MAYILGSNSWNTGTTILVLAIITRWGWGHEKRQKATCRFLEAILAHTGSTKLTRTAVLDY